MAEKPLAPTTEVVVVSCPASLAGQAKPPRCDCGATSFHRHGQYFRRVAKVYVPRVKCTSCKKTHSMLCSSCAPFKHYPLRELEPAVAGMSDGQTTVDLERQAGISRTTIARWYKDFADFLGALTEALTNEHQFTQVKPHPRPVYLAMQGHYQCQRPFGPVQQALSTQWPIRGLFRPVTERAGSGAQNTPGMPPRGHPT